MNTLILIKNPSVNDIEKEFTTEQKRVIYTACAMIDGYTDATAELSRYITKLYRSKDENANIIYNSLKPLQEQQNKYYNELVEELNKIVDEYVTANNNTSTITQQ
jgi:hypothetical protein